MVNRPGSMTGWRPCWRVPRWALVGTMCGAVACLEDHPHEILPGLDPGAAGTEALDNDGRVPGAGGDSSTIQTCPDESSSACAVQTVPLPMGQAGNAGGGVGGANTGQGGSDSEDAGTGATGGNGGSGGIAGGGGSGGTAVAGSTGAGSGGSGGDGTDGSVSPCPTPLEINRNANETLSTDLPAFSDEFDDAAAVRCNYVAAASDDFAVDIDTRVNGSLVFEPETDIPENGWFDSAVGPFVGWLVHGNFVVEVSVRVVAALSSSDAPAGPFADAGLLLRRPNAPGGEAWVKYDLGFLQTDLGRVVKTTSAGRTELFMNNVAGGVAAAANEGGLRVCRVEADFYFFYRLPGTSEWLKEQYRTDTTTYRGTPFTAGTDLYLSRDDLGSPTTPLQVGVTVGYWNSTPRNIVGVFEYVRFGRITDYGGCVAGPTP